VIILSNFIDKRIAAYQKSLITTHFAEVEHMHSQMRGWRHDYHNHIQTLKSLADANDVSSIIRYLSELEDDLSSLDAVVKTGNPMADAILRSKISLAQSKSIHVMADANIAISLTTGAVDLCIIIGNLMDNAIEACMTLPETSRIIRIYMEMKNTQLYISITNAAPSGKRMKLGKHFKTTKGQGHGFGLARVDNIIDRYNGYLSRNSEDGVYSTEVLLPQ